MKQISFKNFRKFKYFPPLDFSPITILVGENNAGKSTVVKAILSILDFIDTQIPFIDPMANKNILKQYFYFNKSYFAHIGTYKRALCNTSDDSEIEMSLTTSNIKITLRIAGDSNDEEAVSGRIVLMKLGMLQIGVELNYNFIENKLYVEFHKPDEVGNFDDNEKYINYCENIPINASFETSITSDSFIVGGSLIDALFTKYVYAIDDIANNEFSDTIIKRYCLSKDTFRFIHQNKNILSLGESGNLFPMIIIKYFNVNIDYIYAHAVTQTIIYSAKDTNDYFVKTIHEFASLGVDDNPKAKKFIHKWMQNFRIGENYEINSVGGEAHIVKINSMDGNSVNLADKGMGSIRLMILIFRLATKIHQTSGSFASRTGRDITIIIEEPEQNLHPTLQSKLAEMFFELYETYRLKFLIETHSEYLIRKTQLIVKEKFGTDEKLVKCPFKVFYFPSEGAPYPMVYKKSGIFENSFGTGFFDEASNLAFELF